MKSLYEELNGSYVEIGDVQVPTLVSTDTKHEIGFWGQRHKEYLKENHRVIYYNLLTSDNLNLYLHEIDIRVSEQYGLLVKQFAENQGVIEQLKVENQILWVQQMNSIANQVREIIFDELIFTYNKTE